MDCFRIDESGYTGAELLDANQPFQGATAISIDDEDAARLINEHFPKLQARELKYTALSRRPANHERLFALQRDLLADFKCVTSICDKRFVLLLKFVDYAVEPSYYERGHDLYADGANQAMASLLYCVGPTLSGKGAFNALLHAFQRAVKLKTKDSLKTLVTTARATNWQELNFALGPLVHADPDCLSAISTPGVTTDAAFVVLHSLISRLEVLSTGPYRVEHDESKNLLQYTNLLSRLIAHTEAVEFHHSAVTTLKFPLKLGRVTQVISDNCPGVQLADVLIGGAIAAARQLTGERKRGIDADKLMALHGDKLIHFLPSPEFAETQQFFKGTQASEFIDYFGKHFS